MIKPLRMPWAAVLAWIVTAALYASGLTGGWLFDDYPNIVDNHGVQPARAGFITLLNAALSSPASEFKRPLASLTFALNYLMAGLNPFWMKLTNLLIHLLNGWLVYRLARLLFEAVATVAPGSRDGAMFIEPQRAARTALILAFGWMVLPINLTAVLYVVQRMESLANLFVLAGLLLFLKGRLALRQGGGWPAWFICLGAITLPTALGLLAKETAVLLPLYALVVEWALFQGRSHSTATSGLRIDRRVYALFGVFLILPMLLGLAWLLPQVLNPIDWTGRNFNLLTRLLSEARIVVGYIVWTVLPPPAALSFYHDDYLVSKDLWTPWTTPASICVLIAMLLAMVWLRRRRPLAALGIALFFAGQSLTATILPLELIYEHRNYFASLGVLLVLLPWLMAPSQRGLKVRRGILTVLLLFWCGQTAMTAYAWGDPLRLAELLAARAPASPRAQYELGRTYIMYSDYDPASPYTAQAYAPLEQAAALPDSSILPQQALIFMNSRMDLPLKPEWWDSMIAKLKTRPLGVQDDSSLVALEVCVRNDHCALPPDRMTAAFEAAISHPRPSAKLLSTYADYAWSELDQHSLALNLIERAVQAAPAEPAYRITWIRMLVRQGQRDAANHQLEALRRLNYGGRLDDVLPGLQSSIAHAQSALD